MKKLVTMRAALEDPNFFGAPTMLGGDSWLPWKTVLIAAMGEVLTPAEREIFRDLTGRDKEPGKPVDELWCIVGRRGGKSRAIAVLGAFLATCVDYRSILAPGQFGLVPILSASRNQASEVLNYLVGIFQNVPALKGMLASDPTAETISLTSRIVLEIRAASYRRARGFTACGVIADEICFWQSDQSVNPDTEILNAVRPSLLTTGGPLIAISSAYSKKGEAYEQFKRHYGADGDPAILYVKASTQRMNPSIPAHFIERAYERDAASAAAEYGSEWRGDLSAFIDDAVLDPLILRGVHQIAPSDGRHYSGFCDAASGGGKDSMTLAISFKEKDDEPAYLACLEERRPPFDPEAVVGDFARILQQYKIRKVVGDKWASGFVEAAFRRHGIHYEASAAPKSQLYLELGPMLNAGQVRLLDHQRLRVQFLGLERRTARGGKDSVDHPVNGHDDCANAACGALVHAAAPRPKPAHMVSMNWMGR